MKRSIFISLLLALSICLGSCRLFHRSQPAAQAVPEFIPGKFTDDYGIIYTITDTLWTQHPRMRFHILKWNLKEQYLIARNDAANPGKDGGLYTRIDYMIFSDMEPWRWGFCLTAYNAKNDSDAEAAASADRQNPRKGCNGFPFSRMKRAE